MSITDFLFSLQKLLAWLLTLLTVLLPQHLLAPLAGADAPATVHAAAPQLCLQPPPPRALDRVALAPSDADKAGVPVPASKDPKAATPTPQPK